MSTRARIVPVAVATVGFLATAARVGAQSCAMCGAAFGADDPVGRAFSWSILFLMAAPYTVVGSIGLWLFLTYRRAQRRQRGAVIAFGRGRAALPTPGLEGDLP